MKRVLILVVLFAFTISFVLIGAGCKEEAAEPAEVVTEEAAEPAEVVTEEVEEAVEETTAAAAEEEEEFEIVMIAKSEGIAWFDAMRKGVEQYGAENPDVNSYQHSPEGAYAEKQVAMIEDYIAKGVDAICIVPTDPKSLLPVVNKATEAGIVIVIHEGSWLCDNAGVYDLEVINNFNLGELMGKRLGEVMDGKGSYASGVGALHMQTHMEWWEGGTSYIKEHWPDIKLLNETPFENHDDVAIAYDNCKQMLLTWPDMTGFLACTDQDGRAMCRLLEETNNTKIMVSGLALPSTMGEWIKKGWSKGGFGNSPVDAGYAAVSIAHMLLKGEEIKDGSVVDLGLPGLDACDVQGLLIQGHAELEFTPENVDQYDF